MRFIILLLLLFSTTHTIAKDTRNVNVINWNKTDNNQIRVIYEITNAKENEVYYLEIEFYDQNNMNIPAFALSGEFPETKGDGIKTLFWNVLRDRQSFPDIGDIQMQVTDYEEFEDPEKAYVQTEDPEEEELIDPPEEKEEPYTEPAEEEVEEETIEKPTEEIVSDQTIESDIDDSKEKDRIFTMGVLGGYNFGYAKKLDMKEYGIFEEQLVGGFYVGGIMAISHISATVDYATQSTMDSEGVDPTIEIHSLMASLDLSNKKYAARKEQSGISGGFGYGIHTTKYSNEEVEHVGIRENEEAFFIKAGLFTSSKSGHLKLQVSYKYHLTQDKMHDFMLGMLLNF